jgi:5'-phosphate synthase pdxT subunit
MARIGVLALQGGYPPHLSVLRRLGHDPIEVRSKTELQGVEGLILPGGESTSQLRLIHRQNLSEALNDFVRSGRPVLATCAGLILAARRVARPEQPSMGWLDVGVERNAWGRQLDSFEAVSDPPRFPVLGSSLPLVFIRAPRIQEVGPAAQVLLTYRDEPILVRQGNIWGATFHPELTEDSSLHQVIFGPSSPKIVHLRTPYWMRMLPAVRGLL